MIVAPTRLFAQAYGRFALGAYSVNNMEQILGLCLGHQQAQAPFILALSRKARSYAGPRMLEAMVTTAARRYPELLFAVHLDHGDEESCMDAIASGVYTSVMIDAAHASFEENIAITRRVVERAGVHGVDVEAELGVIGGKEDDLQVDAAHAWFTDAGQAAEFVERTGVSSLAVAVGTSHGLAKFRGEQGLNITRLADIQARLPGFPLVLHGASGVSLEERERINAAGGQLDLTARGLSAQEIARAIPLGVSKINIDTDARLIWTRVHREYFRDHPADLDFRQPGARFIQAFADFIVHKSQELGSLNRLSAVRQELAAQSAN